MGNVGKTTCPKCGHNALCLCKRQRNGLNLDDIYIFWCNSCRRKQTESRNAGHRIGGKDFPAKTVCPFCGKPPEEHAENISFGQYSLLHEEIVKTNESLPTRVQAKPRAVENAEPLPEIEGTLEPATPKLRPTLALPPRAEKRRTLMKTWKFLARWSTKKLMAVFTIAYTLVLGMLVFTTKLWDEAPVGVALQVALFSTAIVAAWMIICSVLIVRYSRKHYGES